MHRFVGIAAQLEQAKRNGEKLIETLQAVLEESEIRIAELRKAAYEFKRNIVVGAGELRLHGRV